MMPNISIPTTTVLVLADGDTDSATNNAKGHLFESFAARLLAAYGYEHPTQSNVNVNSNGIELDVVTRTRLDNRSAIVECKAYTRSVAARELTSFYGKVAVQRMSDPDALGVMMVIPGLTADGEETARTIAASDARFIYMNVDSVVDSLSREGFIVPPPSDAEATSDPAVLVTEMGIYSAVLEIDPHERTPRRVIVWAASGQVPLPVIRLLAADAYSQGLEIVDANLSSARDAGTAASEDGIVIVGVQASRDDFQYQLPTAPRYFVGRKGPIDVLRTALKNEAPVVVFNAQSGWGKSSLALKFADIVSTKRGHAMILDSRTASSPRYVTEVLRRAFSEAVSMGILTLPSEENWASLPSALATISNARWAEPRRPMVIFFDQFENVFRSIELTRPFRDLALGIREMDTPITIGFAWKTDLVGWIEGHPYQLRDEIRSVAEVILVEPFGSAEVTVILNRLQKASKTKLNRDLRDRLREYSQGLPWLLKKLADHVLRELASGSSQEQLVAEALNVQNLFDGDLVSCAVNLSIKL